MHTAERLSVAFASVYGRRKQAAAAPWTTPLLLPPPLLTLLSLLLLLLLALLAHRDTFSPATANAVRFANRGGSILASQLAQHLGLTTSTPAAPAMPGGCSPQQQLPAIASWCSAFRQGRQLSLRALSAASNCPASPFAVLEPSIPDSCAMTFAPSQVATLQAAVALYRPKLLAAAAAK